MNTLAEIDELKDCARLLAKRVRQLKLPRYQRVKMGSAYVADAVQHLRCVREDLLLLRDQLQYEPNKKGK